LIGLLASRARLRFTGSPSITRTPQAVGQKGTFLLCADMAKKKAKKKAKKVRAEGASEDFNPA
jgi:hypothetical protein